jgi:HSP20 family molecular chaperone IbpA
MSKELGLFPFGSFFGRGFGDWMNEIAGNDTVGNIVCYKVETDTGTKFMFDVPGVQKDGLDLGFGDNGRSLTVSAVRKFNDTEVKMKARVAVPEKADSTGDVKCALKDGVLTVTIPFKKESQPRKLTIE